MFSQALQEAYASAPTDIVIFHTLEFMHPDMTNSVRIVRNSYDITARLEESAPRDPDTDVVFSALAFDIVMAPIEPTAHPEISITIDNVIPQILFYVDSLQNLYHLSIIYRLYLSDDLSTPQMNPPIILQCSQFEAHNTQIIIHATTLHFLNKNFPKDKYELLNFPGLSG